MGLIPSRRPRPVGHAGDLLAVRALDEDGLLERDDGVLVRYVEVLPRNPLVMDDHDLDRLAHGFSQLLSRLPARQAIQVHVDARPVALDELLAEYRRSVDGHAATVDDDRAEGLRRLAGLHEESLAHHAAGHAAVRVRHVLVVPLVPDDPRPVDRLLGRAQRLLDRDGLARRSLALADGLRAELEAADLGARLLDGREVAALLHSRMAPATATPPPGGPLVLTAVADRDDEARARRAARRLRASLATAEIAATDRRHLVVDGGLEQTIHLSGVPEATFTGWLLHAMQSQQPWTLSVHVRALDRARERRRYKQRHRRLYGVNRGAEVAGRVPDYDQRDHESEIAGVVSELTHAATGGLYEISCAQTIRQPDGDPAGLAEAVDQAIGAIQHATDVRVSRGELRQLSLWRSTLPLGLDTTRTSRRMATINAADTLPLVGTGCGSPSGLHLGYAEPGRTLERLDPFDPLHDNGTLIVNAKSGGGKTMLVQHLLAQAIPQGAQAAVIDRSAGHYQFLCSLIPGARHVAVGGPDGATVNPWDVPDPLDVPGSKISFLVRLHTLLIGDHHADADQFGLSPLERNLLELAIRDVYTSCARLRTRPRESLLRDRLLERAAEEAGADAGSRDVAATYRSLAERLHAFCGDGSYGALLDRPTTIDLGDAPLLVLDTSTVPEDVSPAVLFSLSEFLTGHIERRRDQQLGRSNGQGGPFDGRFILVLEELWKLVERRATGSWINEQARRARHLGLFLICVTQQRSDLAGAWGKALLDNSTMQLFLRQSLDELAYLRDALKLTDAEIAQIGHLKTDKRHSAQAYLINGTRGRGTVSIRLGPRMYWALTSDPINDVPEREARLRDRNDDGWAALDAISNLENR